ncbi:hypothetical protein Q7P37_002398 [Cladosporium fusiforme]
MACIAGERHGLDHPHLNTNHDISTNMAELGAIASVIGISAFMLKNIKSAYEVLDGLQNAPHQVKRISQELKTLQDLLNHISTQDDAVPIVKKITEELGLAAILEDCAKVCKDLEAKLEKWMPNTDGPSKRARMRILAHRGAIREWRDVVRETKNTLVYAETIAIRRLQVESLRRQSKISEAQAAHFLQKTATAVSEITREAEHAAQLDNEHDLTEDQQLSRFQGEEPSGEEEASEDSGDDIEPGSVYTAAFQAMVQEASRKATVWSKSSVKQIFGNLQMQDSDEYSQGLEADEVRGDVVQTFGDVTVGSGNKVQQGIYKK